jgi:hypothetical protein
MRLPLKDRVDAAQEKLISRGSLETTNLYKLQCYLLRALKVPGGV